MERASRLALVLLLLVVGMAYYTVRPILHQAGAATEYVARRACLCVYVSERSLARPASGHVYFNLKDRRIPIVVRLAVDDLDAVLLGVEGHGHRMVGGGLFFVGRDGVSREEYESSQE